VNRFVQLKEKIITLESFKEKENYYSYSVNKDKTEKIRVTPQEYNKKLKEIETEMRELADKFGIKLDEYDFKYIKIETKLDFDEWLEKCKDTLKENYDFYEEETTENFEDYCKRLYEETDGILEN